MKEKCFKHGTKISENDESGQPIIYRNIKKPKFLKLKIKVCIEINSGQIEHLQGSRS